jgi:hypothetical protein
MKLAPLLARYFYAHKRLDLPGIGTFYLAQDLNPVSEPGKLAILEGVSFEYNPSTGESTQLIEYIATEAGKLRALAAADIDSHVEQAKQFLHIGKPFLFEGIGSLSKLQTGGYSFTAGTVAVEKLPDTTAREKLQEDRAERSVDYKSILYLKKIKAGWKRPVTIALMIVGLGLAIAGGYMINQRMARKTIDTSTAAIPQSLVLAESDTVKTTAPLVDSIQNNPARYKFIVETAQKDRAIKRYGYLKGNGLAIQMETDDSVSYRLYFMLPASAADTTKIIDSLRNFYTPAGKQAYVSR